MDNEKYYDEDVEVLEEENDVEDSKIERYQINSFQQDKPIETLLKWLHNGKLIMPEFQRDYVWSYSNSCRLVESVLLNLPIPNIFLFKVKRVDGEKFLLIDGKQRMSTLDQYVKGEWVQNENQRPFRIKSPNERWNKKLFSDLSEDDQQFIYDYSISTTIFETSSGQEVNENNVIFSVFERINTGSEKLSDQEIRNAIYEGDCLKLLKDISNNADYQKLIDIDKKLFKRGKYIELLLRFAAYKHIYDISVQGENCLVTGVNESKITTSKKIMLNNYMYYSNLNMIDYHKDFDQIIEAISFIAQYNETAFYAKVRDRNTIGTTVHELFSEALVLAVIANDYQIQIDKQVFDEKKIELWNDEERIDYFKSKTTNPETVIKRVEILLSIIRG